MSTLAKVEQVMRQTKVPMSVREIVDYAGDSLPTRSKTPDTVVARDLSMDIKRNGDDSKFVRTAPGRYSMREFIESGLVKMGDVGASPTVASARKKAEVSEESSVVSNGQSVSTNGVSNSSRGSKGHTLSNGDANGHKALSGASNDRAFATGQSYGVANVHNDSTTGAMGHTELVRESLREERQGLLSAPTRDLSTRSRDESESKAAESE